MKAGVAIMAKKVYVTRAQKDAAKMLVSRSAKTGRYVSANVHKIANAEKRSVEPASPTPTTAKK
jgi:hypothetical protein